MRQFCRIICGTGRHHARADAGRSVAARVQGESPGPGTGPAVRASGRTKTTPGPAAPRPRRAPRHRILHAVPGDRQGDGRRGEGDGVAQVPALGQGDGEGPVEGVSRRSGVDRFDGKGRDEPLLIAAPVVGSQLGHLDHRGRCPPFEKQAGGSSGCPLVVDGDADQILRFGLVRGDDIERREGFRRDAGSRGRVEDDADVAVPGGQSPGAAILPPGPCVRRPPPVAGRCARSPTAGGTAPAVRSGRSPVG